MVLISPTLPPITQSSTPRITPFHRYLPPRPQRYYRLPVVAMLALPNGLILRSNVTISTTTVPTVLLRSALITRPALSPYNKNEKNSGHVTPSPSNGSPSNDTYHPRPPTLARTTQQYPHYSSQLYLPPPIRRNNQRMFIPFPPKGQIRWQIC